MLLYYVCRMMVVVCQPWPPLLFSTPNERDIMYVKCKGGKESELWKTHGTQLFALVLVCISPPFQRIRSEYVR